MFTLQRDYHASLSLSFIIHKYNSKITPAESSRRPIMVAGGKYFARAKTLSPVTSIPRSPLHHYPITISAGSNWVFTSRLEPEPNQTWTGSIINIDDSLLV